MNTRQLVTQLAIQSRTTSRSRPEARHLYRPVSTGEACGFNPLTI